MAFQTLALPVLLGSGWLSSPWMMRLGLAMAGAGQTHLLAVGMFIYMWLQYNENINTHYDVIISDLLNIFTSWFRSSRARWE